MATYIISRHFKSKIDPLQLTKVKMVNGRFNDKSIEREYLRSFSTKIVALKSLYLNIYIVT